MTKRSQQVILFEPDVKTNDSLTLPAEILIQVSSYLDDKSLTLFSTTCKGALNFFNDSLLIRKAQRLVQLIMAGQFVLVEKYLKLFNEDDLNNLITLRVIGQEECMRLWRKKVSALEFAAWAGDTQLLHLLFCNLSMSYRNIALNQLKGVMNKDLEHGEHLAPYYSLIAAYEELQAKANMSILGNSQDLENFKKKIVGKHQYDLPIVGLQQFCCPKENWFRKLPSFKVALTRSCLLLDGTSILPLASSGLGSDFALAKPIDGGAGNITTTAFRALPLSDLINGLRYLCQVRQQELINIIAYLESVCEEKTKIVPSKVDSPNWIHCNKKHRPSYK